MFFFYFDITQVWITNSNFISFFFSFSTYLVPLRRSRFPRAVEGTQTTQFKCFLFRLISPFNRFSLCCLKAPSSCAVPPSIIDDIELDFSRCLCGSVLKNWGRKVNIGTVQLGKKPINSINRFERSVSRALWRNNAVRWHTGQLLEINGRSKIVLKSLTLWPLRSELLVSIIEILDRLNLSKTINRNPFYSFIYV